MKHTPLSTADKLMLGDIFKGEQYEFIVHAVNMHEELVRLLRATAEYLDQGNYPENETQYKLFNDVEKALAQAERK